VLNFEEYTVQTNLALAYSTNTKTLVNRLDWAVLCSSHCKNK
jgi:hypothetical protein